MLDLYPFTLETIRLTAPLIAAIERWDGDLARQLRRAIASVALNLAEGSYSQGKNRRARYFNARGSAREALACLEVAGAFGYLASPAPELHERYLRICATLGKLTR